MGVPVFFKWMCMRNPKILQDAQQGEPESFESGNPAIDNFYVDMNGLIHPACNPKGQNIKEPANFQEQCENIYEYIDKIMNIIRPRGLVYLAIDGVAPRAKMNQQRSRRFRAAMEGEQSLAKKEQLLEKYRREDFINEEGINVIEGYVKKKGFDSNVITPGTQFLSSVADAIRNYVRDRLTNHRLWKNLTVVFSDANCPGEGEHKIIQFIRQQRASPTYDPNQSHCIYGADADLIMLGLATHQPRFYIIREVVITAQEKWCSQCGKRGHYFTDCVAAESIQDQARVQESINAGNIQVSFQFINLKLVREYIHLSFKNARSNLQYDLERLIDDWVFLCFFVGNDFLPHIPCLTIRQGGIDMLLKVYQYCLLLMPDYLTHSGQVNFQSLKIFIKQMSLHEGEIVGQIINKQAQAKNRDFLNRSRSQSSEGKEEMIDLNDPLNRFKQELKKLTNTENNLENYSVFSHQLYSYKQKYYRQKFRIRSCQFLQLKSSISASYLQALSWICKYYYKGVASWSWYYPFHYSPFFSDIDVFDAPSFQLGEPFKPFQQLMAVLPPKTAEALPQHLRLLMTRIESPIADYFPTQFLIDLTGKKFAWLGQVLLPFIDDKRLLRAMGNYQIKLNDREKQLNTMGRVNLYVNKTGKLGRQLVYSSGAGRRTLEAEYQNYGIEGKLQFLQLTGDVQEWDFVTPSGRPHNIHLKEGIMFSLVEELNEDLMRRADRKAYGGQRFIRIIERSLGNRAQQLFGSRPEERRNNYQNNNNRGYNRDNRDSRDYRNQDRQRSRDNRPRHDDRSKDRYNNKRDQDFERRPSNDDKKRQQNRGEKRENRESRDQKEKEY